MRGPLLGGLRPWSGLVCRRRRCHVAPLIGFGDTAGRVAPVPGVRPRGGYERRAGAGPYRGSVHATGVDPDRRRTNVGPAPGPTHGRARAGSPGRLEPALLRAGRPGRLVVTRAAPYYDH
ncbi:hypothetical protein GCM10010195_73790 [Kitasatospora griseola]|nr:hypothetical protein GCM10010195_73790 [Kitasatospora griseola]